MTRCLRGLRGALDALYEQYNCREFVHPDPLEFLYEYSHARDREIVAMLAASLAYGRVTQILRSIRDLLDRMAPSPSTFVERTSAADMLEVFGGFKHRWTTGLEVAQLLWGVRRAVDRYGTLGRCFLSGLRADDQTVVPALATFVAFVSNAGQELGGGRKHRRGRQRPVPGQAHDRALHNSLLPNVSAGGACKRMHLMLRWLVRQDSVDPGGWDGVSPRQLVIPLDTHMHRVGMALGLCRHRQADRRAALDMTAAFATIRLDDPVRYDFALTRLGIRAELDLPAFLSQCRGIQDRSEHL